LELAKTGYLKAKENRPNDPVLLQKIQKTNDKIQSKRNEDIYNTAIALGDQYKQREEYAKAIEAYDKAHTKFINRKYPIEQIAEIKQILQKVENQKKLEKGYMQEIALADNLFLNNNLNAAHKSYSKAALLKNDEEYPKSRISEINSILRRKADSTDKAAQIIKGYQNAMQKAKTAVSKQDYAIAHEAYLEALTFKPEDKQATNLLELNNENKKVSNLNSLYDAALEKATMHL
jgi:tetratricopeptide (TPR) repeat protein